MTHIMMKIRKVRSAFAEMHFDYMFEGTDATQDIIDSVDVNERAKMCLALWGFYVDALSSKRVTSGGSGV